MGLYLSIILQDCKQLELMISKEKMTNPTFPFVKSELLILDKSFQMFQTICIIQQACVIEAVWILNKGQRRNQSLYF